MEEAKKQIKEKKRFTILGFSIWKLLAYFIIYSVLGYMIETIFGIVTKGVWESRQSFLYGPFCGIYGLGAVIMIILLQYFSKNYNTLFLGGFLIGSMIEYVVSLLGELMFHIKWWDYSNMPLNINGRICVFFSLFWGFLAIYLMASLNPKIDRLIAWIKRKVSIKTLKIITLVTILFLVIDCILTGIALEAFYIRMIYENNIEIEEKEKQLVAEAYEKFYGNEKLASFINQFWGNRKMIRTFPNLKVEDKNGNLVYFDSFLKEIQPYYVKVHEPRNLLMQKENNNS